MMTRVYMALVAVSFFNAVYSNRDYVKLSCWADKANRAVPTLEGKDPILDGQYKTRVNPIDKCYQAAKSRGYQYFVIQNGGWCGSSNSADQTYMKHGPSTRCQPDGKGGRWANQLYMIPRGYIKLGCWADKANRAVPTLEGKDPILDGRYKTRVNPIKKCYQAAKRRGYQYFAVQNGGGCGSSNNAEQTYMKYGPSTNCQPDGKGGPWANQLYMITRGTDYIKLGCWADKANRAIPTLEGKDPILDGRYKTRVNPIKKCYQAAKRRGYQYFAVQNGGGCASSNSAEQTYMKYGPSTNCQPDGKGGRWANQLYMIPRGCQSKADIAILVDSSGSVGKTKFRQALRFIQVLVNSTFAVGTHNVRISLITFGNGCNIASTLKDTTTKSDFLAQIQTAKYVGGVTYTHKSLRLTHLAYLNPAKPVGARLGVPKIAIVFTDGYPDDKKQTTIEAELARKQGIEIYAIGMHTKTDYSSLQDMASVPYKTHVSHIDDPDSLANLKENIAYSCSRQAMTATSTQSYPGKTKTTASPSTSRIPLSNAVSSTVSTTKTLSTTSVTTKTTTPSTTSKTATTNPKTGSKKVTTAYTISSPTKTSTPRSGTGTETTRPVTSTTTESSTLTTSTATETRTPHISSTLKSSTLTTSTSSETTTPTTRALTHTTTPATGATTEMATTISTTKLTTPSTSTSSAITAVTDPCKPNPCPLYNGREVQCEPLTNGQFICQKPPDRCVVNNKFYKEKEGWTIGCEERCICIVPTTNFTFCEPLCPDWSVVPAGCTLMPPKPGQCCEELDCSNLTPPP